MVETEQDLRLCYKRMHDLHKSSPKDEEKRYMLNSEFNHAVDTLRWLTYLIPDTSYELQVAALLHDSERWVNTEESYGFQGDRNSPAYFQHKKEHEKRSAAFADEELEKLGVDSCRRYKIRFLLTYHDHTGEEIAAFHNTELEQLAAADSFSFFTSIALNMTEEGNRRERIIEKGVIMVKKMTPEFRQRFQETTFENPRSNDIKSAVLERYATLAAESDPACDAAKKSEYDLYARNTYRLNDPWTPDIGWRPPHYLIQSLWIVTGNLRNLDESKKNRSSILFSQEEIDKIEKRSKSQLQKTKTSFQNELNSLWHGDPEEVDQWLEHYDPVSQLLRPFGISLEWVMREENL